MSKKIQSEESTETTAYNYYYYNPAYPGDSDTPTVFTAIIGKHMIGKLKKLNLLTLAARVEETLIENLGNRLAMVLTKQDSDWAVATDIEGLKIKITNKGGRTKTVYRVSLINNKFIVAIEIPTREVIDTLFKSDDKYLVEDIVDSLNMRQDLYNKKGSFEQRKYSTKDPYPMHRRYT